LGEKGEGVCWIFKKKKGKEENRERQKTGDQKTPINLFETTKKKEKNLAALTWNRAGEMNGGEKDTRW